MLYLTRNARQAIVIDGKIRIVVRALKDGRVRVGIEAPKEVMVERAEVALELDIEGESRAEME